MRLVSRRPHKGRARSTDVTPISFVLLLLLRVVVALLLLLLLLLCCCCVVVVVIVVMFLLELLLRSLELRIGVEVLAAVVADEVLAGVVDGAVIMIGTSC